ncbi:MULTISPECIES: hypothetical protein [unclassified Coleofasciculus]|uniref:hypothetical protein n=1 Tax=unclassified Coleofasciculus TaxID=2692782 RepID=UPI00187E5E23|nr:MULTISPECIES: hypothetical protein [unclassified Coleofasciculus]MBE9129761.1 hypothetical protein [Coleofasciculus sp. LEGE 07081]MBE9152241.1 hypothetical protein [Coleofasciculus sp. LEGE 07092]
MITNVGINWETETSPQEIKLITANSKKTRPRQAPNNFLYDIDFIHLSDFLFKAYYKHGIEGLFEKIKKAKTFEELNLDELKNFIPKSNWQRYFSVLVDYEDTQLQKKMGRTL